MFLHLFITMNVWGQNYEVFVDLENVSYDFKVEMIVPDYQYHTKTTYTLPIGSYGELGEVSLRDFVDDIEVFDKEGKALKFLYWKEHQIVIDNAEELHKISYKVKDFKRLRQKYDLPTNGIMLERDELYLLYANFYLGYLNDLLDIPYDIKIRYPSTVFTTNPLAKAINEREDSYHLEDYATLTRNPIFYAQLDTTSFINDGIRTHISVYSPNKLQTARNIEQIVYPIIGDFKDAVDSLALPAYRFNFFFLPDKSNQQYGGFFHNESSFFLLPEEKNRYQQIDEIQKLSAHELMHTLCPYHLHSDLLENIQYLNGGKMSQHLWMYEGVTEYLSLQMLVSNKRLNQKQFFNEWIKKIVLQKHFPDMSLIEASENIFQARYQKYFANFYHKGALVAFLLDVRLQANTDGEKSMLWLIKELTNKYGSENSFQENQLLEEMAVLGGDELRPIFDSYLFGKGKVPINAYLEKVGYQFYKNYDEKTGMYGMFKINPNVQERSFQFVQVGRNELGLQEGDYLKSINGETLDSYQQYLKLIPVLKKPIPTALITIEVERNGTLQTLSGEPFIFYNPLENVIRPLEQTTEKQLLLRKALFGL